MAGTYIGPPPVVSDAMATERTCVGEPGRSQVSIWMAIRCLGFQSQFQSLWLGLGTGMGMFWSAGGRVHMSNVNLGLSHPSNAID